MANNTTKKAGSNKSFIDRMGGQKFIVLLVVIALFIFFCAMSPNFRKYTTFINILDFSYYIVLSAIGKGKRPFSDMTLKVFSYGCV